MLNYLKRNSKQPEVEAYLKELISSNAITPQERIDIRHVLGSK